MTSLPHQPLRCQVSQLAKVAKASEPIVVAKELFITDLNVVADPFYTQFAPNALPGSSIKAAKGAGAWSFGNLMANFTADGSLRSASRFTLNWLALFETDQIINGQTVPARPSVRTLIIDPWKAASGCVGPDDLCTLNFSNTPFRLEAIVYRPDLRLVPTPADLGYAGQGRFVFTVLAADGTVLPFSVIFKYLLPSSSKQDILDWASSYHELGKVVLGPRSTESFQL